MAASTINTECKRYGCMKNLLACFANCRYTLRCDELRNELVDQTAEAESDINRYLSERGRAPILVQILKRGVKFEAQASRLRRQPIEIASPAASAVKPRVKAAVKLKPATNARASLVSTVKSDRKSDEGKRKPANAHRSTAGLEIKAATKRHPIHQSILRADQPGIENLTSVVPQTAGAVLPQRAAILHVVDAAPRRPEERRSRMRSKMPRKAKTKTTTNATGIDNRALPSQPSTATSGKSEPTTRPSSERARSPRRAAVKSRKPAGQKKVYIIIDGQTASIVDEQGLMAHLLNGNASKARYFEASEVEARVQIVPKR